ncbi:MAG: cell division protein FtsZ, partial [Janthinobacterium lividum]|nr:cell division protein FtsZ [Janthinobacterium lividum]
LDLSASFTGTGQASVGVGQAKGAARSDRASRAVEQAIASIGTAQLAAAAGVLILLIGGRSLRLHEIADTTYAVHAVTARGAAQVLAVQNDERLGDALRVTVIAAGPSA